LSRGSLVNGWLENGFSIKHFSAAAFLEIKSAFDSAWHPAIIAALSKRSCPQYLLKIVSSFLADRCAIFSHNGSSFEKRVEVGCLQGVGGVGGVVWCVCGVGGVDWCWRPARVVSFRRSYGTF
jgi:hypothetical protein